MTRMSRGVPALSHLAPPEATRVHGEKLRDWAPERRGFPPGLTLFDLATLFSLMADKPDARTEQTNGHKHRGGHGHFRHVVTEPASFDAVLRLGGLTQKTFEKLRAQVTPSLRRQTAHAK